MLRDVNSRIDDDDLYAREVSVPHYPVPGGINNALDAFSVDGAALYCARD